MKVIENQREYMRSYLLGVLTEAEQTALEDHFLNDDEVFEQLVAVENELVDTYARGQLNAYEPLNTTHEAGVKIAFRFSGR